MQCVLQESRSRLCGAALLSSNGQCQLPSPRRVPVLAASPLACRRAPGFSLAAGCSLRGSGRLGCRLLPASLSLASCPTGQACRSPPGRCSAVSRQLGSLIVQGRCAAGRKSISFFFKRERGKEKSIDRSAGWLVALLGFRNMVEIDGLMVMGCLLPLLSAWSSIFNTSSVFRIRLTLRGND